MLKQATLASGCGTPYAWPPTNTSSGAKPRPAVPAVRELTVSYLPAQAREASAARSAIGANLTGKGPRRCGSTRDRQQTTGPAHRVERASAAQPGIAALLNQKEPGSPVDAGCPEHTQQVLHDDRLVLDHWPLVATLNTRRLSIAPPADVPQPRRAPQLRLKLPISKNVALKVKDCPRMQSATTHGMKDRTATNLRQGSGTGPT